MESAVLDESRSNDLIAKCSVLIRMKKEEAVDEGQTYSDEDEERELYGHNLSSQDIEEASAVAATFQTEIEELKRKKAEGRSRINNFILNSENFVYGTTFEEFQTPTTPASSSQTPKPKASPVKPVTVKIQEPLADVKIEDDSAATTPQPSTSMPLTVNTGVAASIAGPETTTTVERAARHEAETIASIAELRRQGKWTASRLPVCVEPPRNKTQWDFHLEELKWMANDFNQERRWKKHMARKISHQIAKQFRERELEKEKEKERELKAHKRGCATIARMIREFWQNVNKVYDYKKDSLLKSKKDAAMDKHLQFIIGEADKISQCVAEHITVESSKSPSVSKDEDANDKDFSAEESESDDERTIAKAEKQLKGHDVKKEVHTLGKEADMEIDDLLASLPPDYLKYLQGEKPDEEPKEEEAGGSGDEEDDDEDEDEEEEEEDEMKPSTSQGSPSKGSKSPSKVPVEVEEMKEEVKDDMAESDDEPLIKKIKTTPDPPKEVEETAGDEGEGPSNTGQEEGDEAERDGDRDDSQTRDEKVKLDGVDYAKLKSDNQDEREQELSHIADEALKLLPKGHTLETTQVKTPVPYLLRGTLREYQMVGLDWLVTLYDKNLNGILADEMGLGKTIQTVALLAHLACSERIWGPHLIVVPTSVILNWEMEFKKWCPSLKILTYFGSVKERAEKRKGWMKPNHFHVCITSYKVVTTDIRSFKMRSWQYLILDEAQNIKNWKSERWQKLLNVRARRRLLLTGTPLQNHLMELWSLLHFLMPAIFASHEDFKDWFSNPLTGMMEGNVEFNRGLLDRLHKVLRPFILRRLKADVEKQLPQKTEKTIRCPLSKRQRYLYEDFMSQRETRDNLRSGSMMSVLNIVMQLRKVCNHPNLFALRPVQSPFVMDPIEIGIPSCCLNIIDYESLGDPKIPDIPPALDLRKRMAGWRSGVQSRKPLIEEMLVTDAEPSLPVLKPSTIPGNYFKFERPLVEKPRNSQEFINGGGSPVAYKNRLMEGGVPGRTVNGNGERAYQGHSSESLLSTASPTSRVRPSMMGWKGAAGAPPPAPIREGGATPSISATSAYSTDSRRGSMFGQQPPMQKTGRPPPQMPPTMRTSTISFPSGPPPRSNGMTPDRPGVKRFTETTGEGGREYMEYPPPNPPLKKRRLRPENIYTGEYVDCLTPEARADKEETRDRRFRLAQDRFGLVHEPILSFQLISALWREVRTSRRRAGEWAPTWWKAEREDIQDELSSQTVQLAKGFSVFVDAAYASVAPRIKPLAAIRYMEKNEDEEQCADLNNAYGRFKDRVVQAEAFDFAKYRKGQVELPDFVHNASLARRLQFPEQRLIQYDCGKLQVLARLLRELYIYKHRVLIFTQMSKMLDTLQDFLSYHGYIYYRLDGSTPIEARHAMMERFNADNKVFCFILSTRSGGVGVNLTGADTVIFYDSDWNPTMDAQAQDRCHRIGQTRNVTIYRLISERTIEENILKKANQKKLLGELAIDDAGFTPDFFKQKENLRDLFDVEGGKNVMDDALEEEEEDEGARPSTSKGPSKQDKQEDVEKAMAMVEDDDDVAAARAATKEAVDVDNHEFDEKMVDGGDERYLALLDAMMPIERKAIAVLEHLGSADFQLEMDEAQAQITQKQAEWVQAHQRLMRDEEEVEGGGYDPMLSSLATDEEFAAFDVVFEGQFLPTWEPLTPPMSDGDEDPILYHNPLLDGLYETELMDEMRLPQHIFDLPRPLTKYSHSPVKKVQEHRPSISLSTGNLYTGAPTGADNNSAVMQLLGSAAASMAAQAGGMAAADRDRAYALAGGASGSNAAPTDVDQLLLERMMSIESPSSPSVRRQSTSKKAQRSLFEGQHRQKGAARVMTPPPAEREAKDYEGPPWTIGEDYALLKAVMNEQRLTHHGPLRASLASAATIPDKDLFKAIKVNWEYVAGFVNKVTGVYRSPRQCSVHYQMVVLPRESGMTIALDIFTNKPKKLQPTQSELVHMRQGRTTTQLQYEADNAKILREKELEMLSVKRRIRDKRHPPFKRRAPLAPEATTAGIPSVHRMKINALEFGIPEADRPRQYILWREERRKQYPLHPDRQDSSRDPRKHDSLGSLVEDKPIPAPVRVRPTPCPHMEGPSLPFPEALMIEMPPAPAPLVLPAPALPAPALPPATQRGPVPPASAGVLGMPPSSAPHPISDHLPISRRAPPGTTHIIMGSGSQTGSSSGAGPSGSSGGSGGGGGGGFSGSSQSQYVVVANAEGGGTRMQVVRGEGSSGNSAIYRPNPGTKRAASGQPINRMEYSSGSAGMGGTPPPGSVLVRGPPARGGLGGQRVARPVNMSGGGQRIFMNTMSTGSGASSPSGAGGEGATSAGGSGQTQRYMVAAGTGGPLRVGVAPGSTLGPGRMQAAKRPPGGTLSKTMMLPGRPPGPMQQVRPINRFTGAPSSGGGGPGQHSRVMVMPGGRQYQPPGPQSSVSAGGSGVAGPLPPTLHHSASQPPQATISRPLMTGARTASFARASPSRGPGTPSGGGGIQRRASSSVLPRPARTVPRAPSGLSPDDPAKNQNAGGGEGEGVPERDSTAYLPRLGRRIGRGAWGLCPDELAANQIRSRLAVVVALLICIFQK